MIVINFSQILLLVFWFIFTMLIFILALIARFYESSSGQKTYYRFYVVPIIATGFASARYVSIDQWGGDWIGDLLVFVSGSVLSILCLYLYQQMTTGR